MEKTFEVDLFNSTPAVFNKDTKLLINGSNSIYIKEYSKAVLQAWQIMESSPYKDYKPLYLDPELKTGESSTYLEFKAWQELYLKEPQKGAIAPWTKAEKAYYESLKTKRERYKYLVIRSGLRSSVIDIPYDAYAGVNEKGNLINEEYKELYVKVEANRGFAHLSQGPLAMGEWELAAGILGDIEGFQSAQQIGATGFKARAQAITFLLLQLGYQDSVKSVFEVLIGSLEIRGLIDGLHINKLRALQIKEFAKNPPYDEFGMLPYLDELIGVDWVMNFSIHPYIVDSSGDIIWELKEQVKQGKLKDPRDIDSTPESREEFLQVAYGMLDYQEAYGDCPPSEWSKKSVNLYIDTLILESKIAAITPPQSYPNAPTYFAPELLDDFYQRKILDKLLNPTILTIYRYDFPESLRAKIKAYAKEYNIKE
ncbi:hypothetical protein [Helicobacter rodentium]|uniref:hypothetical protein n=1 Tax=Helicobacter rodentium TaxID=59617 RepID=UPI0026EF8D6B|nr:hypothetical protein [Helicobacter rodentium]